MSAAAFPDGWQLSLLRGYEAASGAWLTPERACRVLWGSACGMACRCACWRHGLHGGRAALVWLAAGPCRHLLEQSLLQCMQPSWWSYYAAAPGVCSTAGMPLAPAAAALMEVDAWGKCLHWSLSSQDAELGRHPVM
jgi:hypothetical protein